MVFNTIFNNISVISWWSVLLVEETVVLGEYYWPVASHWQTLSHNDVHLTLVGFEFATLVIIGTDCIGSYKSNYHCAPTTLGNYKFQTCVPFQLIDFWYFILLHMFFSQKFPVKFWWVWIHNFALNQKCTHTLHYLTVSWHYYNHHRLYYCLAIIVVFCVFCCHLQLVITF